VKKIPAEAGPKASASTVPPVQPRPAVATGAATGAPVATGAATGAPVATGAATGAPVATGAATGAPHFGFGTGSAARFPLAIGLSAVSLSALLLRRLRRR
jgi:hypothetical protein